MVGVVFPTGEQELVRYESTGCCDLKLSAEARVACFAEDCAYKAFVHFSSELVANLLLASGSRHDRSQAPRSELETSEIADRSWSAAEVVTGPPPNICAPHTWRTAQHAAHVLQLVKCRDLGYEQCQPSRPITVVAAAGRHTPGPPRPAPTHRRRPRHLSSRIGRDKPPLQPCMVRGGGSQRAACRPSPGDLWRRR